MVEPPKSRIIFGNELAPIVALCLLLRIVWALLVPVNPVSDSGAYRTFAEQLSAGHGYAYSDGTLTAFWAVGPSALYAAFFAIFGVSNASAILANLLLSALLVSGIYKLGARHFSIVVARTAALAFCCWPVWIQFTTVFSSELPCTALLVWALVVLPDWSKDAQARVGRTVASTALMVGAAYMRPTTLPLVLIIPIIVIFHKRSIYSFKNLLIAVLTASALLAPWALRNKALFGEPVLISANFGTNLWMGNNPASDGGYMPFPDTGTKNEVSRDAKLKADAIAFISQNPSRYLRLCLQRIRISFDRETIGVAWNQHGIKSELKTAIKGISTLYWLVLLVAGTIGAFACVRDRRVELIHVLFVVPALFATTAVMVVGQDRYHMPMMPFIAIFAGYFVERFGISRFVAQSVAAVSISDREARKSD